MRVEEEITYRFINEDWSSSAIGSCFNTEVCLNDIIKVEYMNSAYHDIIKGKLIGVNLNKENKNNDSSKNFIVVDASAKFSSNIIEIPICEIINLENLRDEEDK